MLEIRTFDTGDVRRLALPGASPPSRDDLSWSPDGRFFAYMEGNHQWQVNRLWLLRVEDGEASPITDGPH